jgi:hypothetical protein
MLQEWNSKSAVIYSMWVARNVRNTLQWCQSGRVLCRPVNDPNAQFQYLATVASDLGSPGPKMISMLGTIGDVCKCSQSSH